MNKHFAALASAVDNDEVQLVDNDESNIPFMKDEGVEKVEDTQDKVKVIIHTPKELWGAGAMEFQVSVGMGEMDDAVKYLLNYVNGPLTDHINDKYAPTQVYNAPAEVTPPPPPPANKWQPAPPQHNTYTKDAGGGQVGPTPKQEAMLTKIFKGRDNIPAEVWRMSGKEMFNYMGQFFNKNQ